MFVYGIAGVGKTTLATQAPNPIFLGNEDSDNLVGYAVAPKPKDIYTFKKQLQDLLTEQHEYKTVVVDSIDGIEKLIIDNILSTESKAKNIANARGGYNKGYHEVKSQMEDIRDNYLQPLIDQKNMNVIIICHSENKSFEDPVTDTVFTRIIPNTYKLSTNVWVDWCSIVGYICQEYKTMMRDNKKVVEKETERSFCTGTSKGYIAKTRFKDIPEKINLTNAWSTITTIIKEYYQKETQA